MAEVKAKLSLDNTGFVQGMSAAEQRMAHFGAQIGGVGRGFGAFQKLAGGLGLALEGGDGKNLKEMVITAGVLTGSLLVLNAAVQGVRREFEATKDVFSRTGTEMSIPGWTGAVATQLAGFLATGAFVGTLRRGIFGENEVDKWFNDLTEKIVGGTTKVVDPEKRRQFEEGIFGMRLRNARRELEPSAEERAFAEFKRNPAMGNRALLDMVAKFRAEDSAAKQRTIGSGVDSLTRIGLNTAYAGGMEYAQRTANGVEGVLQLLRDFAAGRLGLTNGVAVTQ